ncbi:hypothetical protein D3C79_1063310 [compost metagenome]
MGTASKFTIRCQLPHLDKAVGQILDAQLSEVKLAKARGIRYQSAAYLNQLDMPGRMLTAS